MRQSSDQLSPADRLDRARVSWLNSGGPRTAGLVDGARYCQEMARREARNFYWGFLALPREQRVAIYALYSFARQVDDDVDLQSDGHVGDLFAHHRRRLDGCYREGGLEYLPGDGPDDPVMVVLRQVVRAYGIPRSELEALIEGVEMDLQIGRYQTWEELRPYCERVASTVGRMCVRVFGYDDPLALDRALDLGLAMQLSNILRDVREDFDLGRVYLPQAELRRFGISEDGLRSGEPGPGWENLVQSEIQRARGYFESGLRVTESIPRRAAACVLTMSGMYLQILSEIERDPFLPLRRRASLGKRAKLLVMARSWLQAV